MNGTVCGKASSQICPCSSEVKVWHPAMKCWLVSDPPYSSEWCLGVWLQLRLQMWPIKHENSFFSRHESCLPILPMFLLRLRSPLKACVNNTTPGFGRLKPAASSADLSKKWWWKSGFFPCVLSQYFSWWTRLCRRHLYRIRLTFDCLSKERLVQPGCVAHRSVVEGSSAVLQNQIDCKMIIRIKLKAWYLAIYSCELFTPCMLSGWNINPSYKKQKTLGLSRFRRETHSWNGFKRLALLQPLRLQIQKLFRKPSKKKTAGFSTPVHRMSISEFASFVSVHVTIAFLFFQCSVDT